MKIIIVVVFLLLPCLSYSQPMFTSSDYPKIGDSALTVLFPFQTVEASRVTATGGSYTWDFSGESNWTILSQSTGLQRVYRYESPKPPHSVSFPEANFSEVSVSTDGYNTFEMRSDTLFQLAAGGTSSSVGTPYFPPVPIVIFPMTLGQTAEFSTGLKPTKTYPDPVAIREHNVTYDGYGTVKLPWGTFDDCIRLKMQTRDSNYLTGFTTYSYQYLWLKRGGAVPVMRLSYLGYYAENSFDVWATLSSGMNSVDRDNTSEFPIASTMITDGILRIECQKPAVYEIYSSLGIKVMESSLPGSTTIDVRTLPAGMYQLRCLADRTTQKFMIVK